MNREMKAALDDALSEILAMSSEQFLAEARSINSGAVYEFFMDSKRFAEFDISELEPLQLLFSETMALKTVEDFSDTEMYVSQNSAQGLDHAGYALAA